MREFFETRLAAKRFVDKNTAKPINSVFNSASIFSELKRVK
jgi:hypothetical protein